jgi:hypothetical protein
MLQIAVVNDRLQFGDQGFAISFQRTLRIPDDGRTYPLPPGLGAFPICRVADYANRVPSAWNQPDSVFIPLYPYEALWVRFHSRGWKPNAVKVGVGSLNAVSGGAWETALRPTEQDYVVSPPQNWLDGFHAGSGLVRQFVAQPSEASADSGGLHVVVYEAKAGKFPDEQPAFERNSLRRPGAIGLSASGSATGHTALNIGGGGHLKQTIYPDSHGMDTWDADNPAQVRVYLVNSAVYQQITGEAPPPTPVSAESYRQAGLTWLPECKQPRT